MTLYRESGLDAELQEKMMANGKQYCLYGNAGYVPSAHLQGFYARAGASDVQNIYKTFISTVSDAVERTL